MQKAVCELSARPIMSRFLLKINIHCHRRGSLWRREWSSPANSTQFTKSSPTWTNYHVYALLPTNLRTRRQDMFHERQK